MKESLLGKSHALFKTANRLQCSFPFKTIALKYFSEVELVGSAKTDLMWAPDIDFDCVTKLELSSILDFVSDLFSVDPVGKVILYNHLHDEEPHFIVNIENFLFAGNLWIITFFIIQGKCLEREYARWVQENIDDRKRLLILRIKRDRENKGMQKTVPSKSIYDAVLKNKVHSISEFWSLVKRGECS
jgi:hypothetical protein